MVMVENNGFEPLTSCLQGLQKQKRQTATCAEKYGDYSFLFFYDDNIDDKILIIFLLNLPRPQTLKVVPANLLVV